MKTPDEIKKGLACRILGSAEKCDQKCSTCQLFVPGYLYPEIYKDALALIQQLEAGIDEFEMVAASPGVVEDMARENAELLEKVKQLEKERDAAVADLATIHKCEPCKHRTSNSYISNECLDCVNFCNFEWRGPCEENGGVNDGQESN